MKFEITNNSKALQGVHGAAGLVHIEPGATRTVDVLEDYVERLTSLPFLASKAVDDPLDHDDDGEKGGAHPPVGEGYDGMTVAQLRELAAEREIDLGDAKKRDDIVAALQLADETAAEAAVEETTAEGGPVTTPAGETTAEA